MSNLDEPQAAAQQALDELGPALDERPVDEGEGDGPSPDRALEIEVRLAVDALDFALSTAFGPPLKASEQEKAQLVAGWVPFAREKGGFDLPAWVPGLVASLIVYGPKIRGKAIASRLTRSGARRPPAPDPVAPEEVRPDSVEEG